MLARLPFSLRYIAKQGATPISITTEAEVVGLSDNKTSLLTTVASQGLLRVCVWRKKPPLLHVNKPTLC